MYAARRAIATAAHAKLINKKFHDASYCKFISETVAFLETWKTLLPEHDDTRRLP
jgi:hypothetical protein